MKYGHGRDGVRYVTSAASVVAQCAPVLQTGQDVLDASAPAPMTPPRSVAHHRAAPKPRRYELTDPARPTIREHPSVMAAEVCHHGSAVAHRIVAMARPAGMNRDHASVPPTDQHLRVARVAVVLRTCR